MAKIAVTGANGTIGTPLCQDLAHDHDIVRVDLSGDADVVTDIQDLAALERAFGDCETVIHLAGASSVDSTWSQTYGANIGGAYNAFEAARRAGCKRVIFASSNHAVGRYEVDLAPGLYEPGAGIIIRPDDPIRPDSLYGVSKVFGEALGRYYSEVHGLQVACVRIGSITREDDPRHPAIGASSSSLLTLSTEQKYRRYAATWMSQRDFVRLVRAILAHDVPYAVVYGVGDNATRFWDLEPGRAIYGFWPQDGVRGERDEPAPSSR